MTVERFQVTRDLAAAPEDVFAILCDPARHVAIDSSGMLQWAEGEVVRQPGDTFVVHMDREALNDYPMGKYDVTVIITRLEANRLIEWTISGTVQPPIRHLYGYKIEPVPGGCRVTSYLLRLERDRTAVPRAGDLPGDSGGGPAGDPRHPRSDGGA